MGIFSRLRFKYKVVILNEHTLEDKFHTRISIFSMMAWMGLFCLLSFCLLSAIILITPLKYLLPGYAEMSIREDVVNEALRIDSISTKLDNTDRQMIILKNIIAGNIEVDSITVTDTLSIEQLKSLPLGPTRQEQQYQEQYEENNRYNINDYIASPTTEEMVFVIPVHGAINSHFNISDRRFGIQILASNDKPVLAAQSGTIIYSYAASANANTLVILHNNGYITIYRSLGRILHSAGETLAAGQAIAFVGSEDKTVKENSVVDFELWHDGKPIDPEKYIVF